MSTSASLIGVKLGNYELQALLGRGGMASVYRALDLNLRRAVAVKVLSAATAAQPDFVERFRQEARLIANLRHPNIVRVYDFGEQAGYIYMVQELLPGPTLEERMGEQAARGQRLARADVLTVITQLAAALDAAHAAGVIHRDIKPANAMWNAEGALVLTDFGIAKNLLNTSGHTQAGMVIGTPNYLSPEQAQGVPPTRASDIYSLGVVLYELISGQTPFGGSTTMRIVFDHIQTPPPPLGPQRPDLPPAVEAVVNRALAKDPARRFASAGELARALSQAWPAQPAAGPPPAGIHDQATTVWERPKPPAPTPLPAQPTPARPAPPATTYQPTSRQSVAVPPAPAPERGRRSAALPVLAALLLLLLVGGGALALRAIGDTAAPIDPPPSVVVEASATPEPTAVPEPTLAPEPSPPPATATPVPPPPEPLPLPTLPTLPVPPPPEPLPLPTLPTLPLEPTLTRVASEPNPLPPTTPPEPTEAPEPTEVPDEPIAQLRALFDTAGEIGANFNLGLNAVEEALANDDQKGAEQELRKLRQEVNRSERTGRIDAEFTEQALSGIEAVADEYDLDLSSNGEGTDG